VVKGSASIVDNKNGTAFESKKYAYNNNYKGKNPMTKSQQRRYQRSKKGIAASLEDQTLDTKPSLEDQSSLTLGNDEDDHHI
jgi:hypothetical protein